jgi:hypothetical protein
MLVAAAHKSRSVLLAACLVDSVQFCSDGGSTFREVASDVGCGNPQYTQRTAGRLPPLLCATTQWTRPHPVSQDGVGFRSKVHSHLFLLINVFAQLCDDVSLNFTNTTA